MSRRAARAAGLALRLTRDHCRWRSRVREGEGRSARRPQTIIERGVLWTGAKPAGGAIGAIVAEAASGFLFGGCELVTSGIATPLCTVAVLGAGAGVGSATGDDAANIGFDVIDSRMTLQMDWR